MSVCRMKSVERGRGARVALAGLALVGPALFGAACAGRSALGWSAASRARTLAGDWVDSAKATPTDTTAWRLGADGSDWTVTVHVRREGLAGAAAVERATRYGYWYLQGALADSVGRGLCFKKRPRDGATCYPFQVDTIVVSGEPRRRLRVSGYAGQRHTRTRVLIERSDGAAR